MKKGTKISEDLISVEFTIKSVPTVSALMWRSVRETLTGKIVAGVATLAIVVTVSSGIFPRPDQAIANHGPYAGKLFKAQGAAVDVQVKLCHDNNGASDYSEVQGQADAIVAVANNGHPPTGNHLNDIIPPFHYDFDENGVEDASSPYPGRNWTASFIAIWNNGCEEPTPTPYPTPTYPTPTYPTPTYPTPTYPTPTYPTPSYPTPAPNTGSLLVTKVTVNANGTFDFTGDNGISAFQITTTDNTGSQTLSDLTPNFYHITEGTLPTGWAQTGNTCDDNDGGITVVAGQQASCVITNTFTRTPMYSISGKVYHDNDSENGTFDGETEEDPTPEDGLESWTVYIDKSAGDNADNNSLDEGETSTLSDANGNYEFTGLAAGCYTVREVLQSGWNQTEPTVVDDFEYQVSLGGAICSVDEISLLDSVLGYFSIKTANAIAIVQTYNFGNVQQPTRSGGGGGGSSSSRVPQVLGETDFGPGLQMPQVAGVTELPRTGSELALMVLPMLAALPLLRKRK